MLQCPGCPAILFSISGPFGTTKPLRNRLAACLLSLCPFILSAAAANPPQPPHHHPSTSASLQPTSTRSAEWRRCTHSHSASALPGRLGSASAVTERPRRRRSAQPQCTRTALGMRHLKGARDAREDAAADGQTLADLCGGARSSPTETATSQSSRIEPSSSRPNAQPWRGRRLPR